MINVFVSVHKEKYVWRSQRVFLKESCFIELRNIPKSLAEILTCFYKHAGKAGQRDNS